MDFTQPMFISLPGFKKEAYANLSPNAADWQHDITKMVYDKIGYVTKFPTKIRIQRFDEQHGFGYGSIKVGNEIDIPLIIKNFELQKMDVFLYRGEYFPLSEERVEELMFNPNVFGNPADVSGQDQSIYTNTYPPHGGKYIYASVNMLAKLDKQVTKADKDKFASEIGKDVFAAFKHNRTLGILKTAASLSVRTKKTINSVLPVDIIQISKFAGMKSTALFDESNIISEKEIFEVKTASDRVYDPQTAYLDKPALFKKFGEEIARQVLEKGEFTTIRGTRPFRPVLDENIDSDKASQIKSMGKYEVMDIDGDRRIGWVLPNVYDFDLKKVDEKVFTDGLAYAYQNDIVGKEVSSASNPESKDEIPRSELIEGRTGVLCLNRGKSAMCTVPFTIASALYDQGTHIRFEASDVFGRAFIIEISPGVKSITKSKTQKYVYTVPADAYFVEVGRNIIRLQDSKKDYDINVEAIKRAASKDVVIVTCDDGNVFNIAGDNLKDVSNDARGVGHTKAKWYLVSLGLTPASADQTLQRAKENGVARVLDTKPLITSTEKQAQVIAEKVIPLLQKVGNLKKHLIKEASVLDDEQVVDKVLSLNFLTPENIGTFVQNIPAFEDAVKKLAQLLIAIRVGLKQVPEYAAENAMRNLDSVISALKGLEAVGNVNNPETTIF